MLLLLLCIMNWTHFWHLPAFRVHSHPYLHKGLAKALNVSFARKLGMPSRLLNILGFNFLAIIIMSFSVNTDRLIALLLIFISRYKMLCWPRQHHRHYITIFSGVLKMQAWSNISACITEEFCFWCQKVFGTVLMFSKFVKYCKYAFLIIQSVNALGNLFFWNIQYCQIFSTFANGYT